MNYSQKKLNQNHYEIKCLGICSWWVFIRHYGHDGYLSSPSRMIYYTSSLRNAQEWIKTNDYSAWQHEEITVLNLYRSESDCFILSNN